MHNTTGVALKRQMEVAVDLRATVLYYTAIPRSEIAGYL
jgi:hypothetical protein